MEAEQEVIEPDEQVLVHDITDDDNVKPPTLADQLRARRKEIAESKTVMLPLTGYEEHGVLVQHHLMDRVEVEVIGRKVLNETKNRAERNMRILLDVIINSTDGFYLQPEGADPDEIRDDRNGNEPVYGWDGFARYLGWQQNVGEGDARSALYFVFGGNEFAVGQYGILLNRWMGNTGLKVDEEFLGETL
jgi:hypothetical protein